MDRDLYDYRTIEQLDNPDPMCDCGAILTTADDQDPEGLICNACDRLAMHEQWQAACEITRSFQR